MRGREGGREDEGGRAREGGRDGRTCTSNGRADRTGEFNGFGCNGSIARIHPHPGEVDLTVHLKKGRAGGIDGGREG